MKETDFLLNFRVYNLEEEAYTRQQYNYLLKIVENSIKKDRVLLEHIAGSPDLVLRKWHLS